MQISIHALRAEGDARLRHLALACDISIHALRAEGDAAIQWDEGENTVFLSTPSVRRATEEQLHHYLGLEFLSTPSVRRATRSMIKS